MNKMQQYFKTANKQQKYFIYTLILAILFSIFTQLMLTIIQQQSSLKQSNNSLKEKLLEDSLSKLETQLALKKRELLSVTTKEETYQEKLRYLISGLDKLKYTFNDKNWAKNIDDILTNSLQKNLKITYLKTAKVPTLSTEEILKKTRQIQISGNGNYIDVVAFISYIDNLKSLLKFTKISIVQEQQEVSFLLYIDMYAIES